MTDTMTRVNAPARRGPVGESTVNEAFLREVLAWIELHPERWDQREWVEHTACGTTYCLAGWAYVLGTGHWFSDRDLMERLPVVPMAVELLGLTQDQARELFYFSTVLVPGRQNNGLGVARPPTFAELCAKVEEVTGVRFKPAVEPVDG